MRILCCLLQDFHNAVLPLRTRSRSLYWGNRSAQYKLREVYSLSVIRSRAVWLPFCHCERSEAISYLDCFVPIAFTQGSSQWQFRAVIAMTKETIFYADILRLTAGSFIQVFAILAVLFYYAELEKENNPWLKLLLHLC